MDALKSYAAVVVCACMAITAAVLAIGFALNGRGKLALGAAVLVLAAVAFLEHELAEIRRDRRLRLPPFTTTRSSEQPQRRPVR